MNSGGKVMVRLRMITKGLAQAGRLDGHGQKYARVMRLAGLLAVVFLYLCGPASSLLYAIGYDNNYSQAMPEAMSLSWEKFIEETKEISDKPFKESSFSYTMRLPKNWQQSGFSVLEDSKGTQFSYGAIVEYIGPVQYGVSPYLEIQSYEQKSAMSAYHWLHNFMLSNGYSIEVLAADGWDKAEAMYIIFDRGNSYKVRLKAFLYGKHVILGSFYMPVSQWQNEKDLQTRVMESLSISKTKKTAEQVKEYTLYNIAKFDFYDAWIFDSDPSANLGKIKVRFTHESDESASSDKYRKVDGVLHLMLIEKRADPDLAQEVAVIRSEVEERGYLLGELIEKNVEFELEPRIKALGIEAYELLDESGKRIDHELWVGIMRGRDYYYFVVLDTPSRDGNYEQWAHNIDAFRLLVMTLTPL